MASMAESSLGSVPIRQIDTLRVHMLEHAQAYLVVPEHDQTTDTGRRQQDANALPELPIHVQIPASLTADTCPPHDAAHLSRSSPVRKRNTYVIPSASAPEKGMEGMFEATLSQKAFHQLTKAASFHTYPDGDTQPMESQVYRDFNESMAGQTVDVGSRVDAGAMEELPDTCDANAFSQTLRTCEEGDTGYIDLERAFQPPSPASTAGFDELLASPQTQVQSTAVAHLPGGFAMPETPAHATGKHGRDVEPLTSATTATKKTPAYSQLFGKTQGGQVLSATQLFNQTQAPSSPMPDQIRSDPIVTRPSPNMNGPNATSSPLNAFSSPIPSAGGPPSNAADPRGTYMSMQESQELRHARLKPTQFRRKENGDDDFWNDDNDDTDNDDASRSRLQQRSTHRKTAEQSLPSNPKSKTHRIRSSSRPSSANGLHSTISLVDTPATVQRGERIQFDDEFLQDDSNDDDDDGEANEGEMGPDPNDNDDYDELGQVLRSQSNNDDEDVSGPSQTDKQATDSERKKIKNNPVLQTNNAIRGPTQHSAIADSQPPTQEKHEQTRSNHTVQHLSSASFVPGSQYIGRTSQDLARLAASQYTRSSPPKVQEKIASSPPLPQPVERVGGNHLDSSELSAVQFDKSPRAISRDQDVTTTELEVPESDLSEIHQSRLRAPSLQVGSNSFPMFFTAKTHTSNDASSSSNTNNVQASPNRLFNSQQSRVSEFSPRKAAGVRHFSEIAGMTPPGGSGQTQKDITAVVDGILTAEDMEYMAAVADSPGPRTRKKRKLVHETPVTGDAPHVAVSIAANDRGQAVTRLEREVVRIDEDCESGQPRLVSPSILQARPSKCSVLKGPVSTYEKPPASSSESVRLREIAGARAVSQLLSIRGNKALNKEKTYSRKAAARKSRKNRRRRDGIKTDDDGVRDSREKRAPADHRSDDREEDNVAEEAQNSTNGRLDLEVAESCSKGLGEMPGPAMSNPERVFALFKGKYNQFFPARWLGYSRDALTSEVQFDDGTTTTIDTCHVRALDLRVGDSIKIDRPDMRKETWLIVDFGDITQTGTEGALATDVHGRSHAVVQAKSTRTSTTNANATALVNAEPRTIPVANMYITQTMWKHFADRIFAPPPVRRKEAARAETPSTQPQTPVVITPGSRVRRSAQSVLPGLHARSTHLGEGSVASPLGASTSGIFKGMAFAVSFSQGEEHKSSSVTSLIRRSGGTVLDSSFLELFDDPGPDSNTGTPSKKSPRVEKSHDDVLALKIKSEFKDLGFVALISNSHHRKAKYIQALALNLPTLSAKWVTDCLDAGKNPSLNTFDVKPLDWSKYLLPAGESSYLDGAIRSRTSVHENESSAQFSVVIASRPRLLKNEGVLLFPGKDKTSRDKCDIFAFLTLALGASRVRKLTGVKDIQAICIEQPEAWKWIYVDGSVTDAVAALSGENPGDTVAGGKKRKRGQDPKSTLTMSAMYGTVKVVSDEYVIQSLILGALVD